VPATQKFGIADQHDAHLARDARVSAPSCET
jgi:hypothetical protein